MDFDDKNKKAEDIVNYFKETEQRKALCDEIAKIGLDQTDFTQKYNIERLLIADVAVLEEVLAELKKQTKLQQEILNELKKANKQTKKPQAKLEDFDEDYPAIDHWIDGV